MIPRVILHNVVSVDGRIDGFTPDLEQYYGLISRWQEDATLAGSNTIFKSEAEVPEEDAAAFEPPQVDPDDRRPLLVVPDSTGRVRNWHVLRQWPFWRASVALCSRTTPASYLDYLQERHVDTIVAGDERVDLPAALEELNARYGIRTIRVDSGGTLNGVLLRAGLVHEVSVLIHPCLVGGLTPSSIFRAPDLTSPEDVIPVRLAHVEQLKDDVVWLRYDVLR